MNNSACRGAPLDAVWPCGWVGKKHLSLRDGDDPSPSRSTIYHFASHIHYIRYALRRSLCGRVLLWPVPINAYTIIIL